MEQTFQGSYSIYKDDGIWKPLSCGGPKKLDVPNIQQWCCPGVAIVFHMPSTGSQEVSLNHVGVLKDVLKLNCGPLHTLVIFFRCEWMTKDDNHVNPTYIRDDVGFTIVNLCL